MKTVKNLFSILMIAFSLVLVSCGDESEDPKPQKTDLEVVKEGIVGYWSLQSIVMTKGAEVVTYNGECNESSYPAWVQANVANVDFEFIDATNVKVHVQCPTVSTLSKTYTVTQAGDKFTVTTSNGYVFELIMSSPDEIENSTVNASRLDGLVSGATKAVWKFTK